MSQLSDMCCCAAVADALSCSARLHLPLGLLCRLLLQLCAVKRSWGRDTCGQTGNSEWPGLWMSPGLQLLLRLQQLLALQLQLQPVTRQTNIWAVCSF